MSAWTKHQLTLTRTTANAAAPWLAGQGTPETIGPLVGCVIRRLMKPADVNVNGATGAAEVVNQPFAVVIVLNQSDNPGTPLWDASGVAIVRINDLITQSDAQPSQLNGQSAVVEVVRTYDGQLQLNVRIGTT